jgi:hypothetical protein
MQQRAAVSRALAVVTLGLATSSAFAPAVPDRNAYFGETHVHTSWSFDAYIFGGHLTGPADAHVEPTDLWEKRTTSE